VIRSTVLVVGGEAVDAGVGPAVCELARRTRTGVLNTWRAKGLFRFDDPAHLGTIGLQRDDLVLAGVAGEQRSFERVVLCGVADGELPDHLTGGLPADAEVVSPGDVAALHLDVRDDWLPRPPLYDALASVCGPRYLVDDVPLSPVRAAGDLAAWLPAGAVVTADAGAPGFWLGRTFPTRTPQTVLLPARPDPQFTTRVVASASAGCVVVRGPGAPVAERDEVDAAPGCAVGRGGAGARWVVVERWLPDGPRLSPAARVAQLDAVVAAGGGVVEVGVDLDDVGALEEVAGPVVVWGGPATGWGAA
jgi:hypothetical protein